MTVLTACAYRTQGSGEVRAVRLVSTDRLPK